MSRRGAPATGSSERAPTVLRTVLVLLVVISTWPVAGMSAATMGAPTERRIDAVVPGILAGSWRATAGSSTGFRVTTNTFLVGRRQITGRTTAVTGSATVRLTNGRDRLTIARFSADLRKLSSGNSLYDREIASLLETGRHPLAVFVLRVPATLPTASALAAGATVTIYGNLTLHGVTRRVTVAARIIGTASRFTVSGALAVRISDYGIANQASGGLTSVDDQATFDFRIVFIR